MFTSVITKARSLLDRIRAGPSQDISDAGAERRVRDATGAVLALISLLAIVACVGAAIALTQTRSLKSEVAALHRELAPLKERVAQLDQAEKERRQAEQQQDAKDKSAIERSNRLGEAQAALNLSSEEVQLVRVYIRPAPSTGAPADTIKVGDIVGGAMIPLPSALTEKIPKLLGARFAIRNGAIIIVRKDSRQADAVLGPN
jgi:cell division protein FtsB